MGETASPPIPPSFFIEYDMGDRGNCVFLRVSKKRLISILLYNIYKLSIGQEIH
jgi:hypothetical protein